MRHGILAHEKLGLFGAVVHGGGGGKGGGKAPPPPPPKDTPTERDTVTDPDALKKSRQANQEDQDRRSRRKTQIPLAPNSKTGSGSGLSIG